MAKQKTKTENRLSGEALTAEILSALKGIKYGHVQITVQDSRVVQIDKTEKFRMSMQKGGDE